MLGVWLLTSPWLLSMAAGNTPAARSAWGVGTAIVALSLFAMYKHAVWGDALGVMFGTWLIASPWVLGFAGASVAAANVVIVGVLVVGYAIWAMRINISTGDSTAHDLHRGRPA